ncbi:MAG TPA: hypothetical protein VF629_05095 [Hymenobacter sp.]|jgi:hypothetical protein|uniref:hypothetical protein n=1 Tax=Hymenobacter sp. TaxID=1898978 RepID=UPI002ED94B8D
MSDLQNPLFEEEKEFLERKKLEYERALRGDVDHIKDQSVKAGKVALVGAGLAGSIWLITKAFSGKKRKRYGKRSDDKYASYDPDFDDQDTPDFDGADQDQDQDSEFGAQYFTAGNGKRYKSKTSYKSAAASAAVFQEQQDQDHNDQPEQEYESDDFGFGNRPAAQSYHADAAHDEDQHREPSPFDTEDFEDDPFQDLPYDDSRRLPASHAFDNEDGQANANSNSRSKMIGSVLKAFLQTDTGKVLVGQVAAVGLALVTKKVSEFFPAHKNPDLAASPGYAPAETGFSPVSAAAPVASSVSLDSPDASTHSQSI